MLRPVFASSFALTLLLGGTGALAQTAPYPSKTVRVIVPFSAGGTTDVLGRLVAQRLGTMYGQQFVIDNRLGGGGHIGAEVVARAAPDGYTLMVGTIGIHATYGIYSKLPYDPARDIQPVILMAKSPLVVLVHPTFPVRTVRELVALAKARPGEINFGSAGFGSSTHMTAELFEMMAKVKMTHVPYKGSAPSLSDLMGGQIQAMFEVVSPALPSYISSGRLRALAVTTSERLPLLKDLPTVAEAGIPGYESSAWYTFAAPSKVPPSIIQKLNADMNAILGSQEMQPRIAELAATRMGGTPEAASKFFDAEREKWNKVIQTAGIRAD
jgi:tripartite-type tricarboxylate transporter receptor subunit TctC